MKTHKSKSNLDFESNLRNSQ